MKDVFAIIGVLTVMTASVVALIGLFSLGWIVITDRIADWRHPWRGD